MRTWTGELRTVIRDEWDEVLRGGRGLLLLLLLPAVLFLALETEQSQTPARVLVAGTASDPDVTRRLVAVMRESALLDVEKEEEPAAADPLAVVNGRALDILLNYEGSPKPQLAMYSAETDPRRLAELERIGAGIVRAEAVIAQRIGAAKDARRAAGEKPPRIVPERKPLFDAQPWATAELYEDLLMLGPLPVLPLAEYFPQAADPRAANVPTLILLIVTLLPFALALATALRRGTPSIVPEGPWRGAIVETVGRIAVPAALTLIELLAIVLLAETILDVHMKAGVLRMGALVAVAAACSACAALAIAAWSRTRVDVAAWSTLYVIASVLVIIIPLPRQQSWVRALALYLPAAHLQPALTRWLFGAPYDASTLAHAGWLLALTVASGAFVALAYRMLAPLPEAGVVVLRTDDVAASDHGAGAPNVDSF